MASILRSVGILTVSLVASVHLRLLWEFDPSKEEALTPSLPPSWKLELLRRIEHEEHILRNHRFLPSTRQTEALSIVQFLTNTVGDQYRGLLRARVATEARFWKTLNALEQNIDGIVSIKKEPTTILVQDGEKLGQFAKIDKVDDNERERMFDEVMFFVSQNQQNVEIIPSIVALDQELSEQGLESPSKDFIEVEKATGLIDENDFVDNEEDDYMNGAENDYFEEEDLIEGSRGEMEEEGLTDDEEDVADYEDEIEYKEGRTDNKINYDEFFPLETYKERGRELERALQQRASVEGCPSTPDGCRRLLEKLQFIEEETIQRRNVIARRWNLLRRKRREISPDKSSCATVAHVREEFSNFLRNFRAAESSVFVEPSNATIDLWSILESPLLYETFDALDSLVELISGHVEILDRAVDWAVDATSPPKTFIGNHEDNENEEVTLGINLVKLARQRWTKMSLKLPPELKEFVTRYLSEPRYGLLLESWKNSLRSIDPTYMELQHRWEEATMESLKNNYDQGGIDELIVTSFQRIKMFWENDSSSNHL